MKEKIEQLIEEMEERQKGFAELADSLNKFDEPKYYSGREDEAKAVIFMLKAILSPDEEEKTFDGELSGCQLNNE